MFLGGCIGDMMHCYNEWFELVSLGFAVFVVFPVGIGGHGMLM